MMSREVHVQTFKSESRLKLVKVEKQMRKILNPDMSSNIDTSFTAALLSMVHLILWDPSGLGLRGAVT